MLGGVVGACLILGNEKQPLEKLLRGRWDSIRLCDYCSGRWESLVDWTGRVALGVLC